MAIRLYLDIEGTPNSNQQDKLDQHVPQASEYPDEFNTFGFGRVTPTVYYTAEALGHDGEVGSTTDPKQVHALLLAQGLQPQAAADLANVGFGVAWN